MLTRQHRLLVAAAAAAALLTSCSSAPADPPAAPTAALPTGPNDVAAELPAPAPSPVDDAASRTEAEVAATATMTSFIQVQLPPDEWLLELSPHLTASARDAYVGTDPLEVPARQLTGPARWAGSSSAYLAAVTVPTDVGDYQLLLVREGQGAAWLAETLTPPDGLR